MTSNYMGDAADLADVRHDVPRFPDVEVELVGHDGNAFAILGRVRRALTSAGATSGELDAFTREATSGDYDHLLSTCARWVVVS